VKPWERALARDPMCAFVEAVVDGYSPLDKHLCKLARAGALLRSLPWWTTVPEDDGVRGSVRRTKGFAVLETGEGPAGSWHQQQNGGHRVWTTAAGEIPNAR
jgi:hypothetical protein